jgi:hypothetical protein
MFNPLFTLLFSCATESPQDSKSEAWCSADQPSPYPLESSYVGIHGNAANNDIVPCRTADSYTEEWHALRGLALTQPTTFSPDGLTTYATSANPEPTGCRLHAIDVRTGETRWCKTHHRSISYSAVEVDDSGNLYFTAEDRVYSLDQQGNERWTRILEAAVPTTENYAWGLHFTPDGHVASVTQSGMVYLLEKDSGEVLNSLSIPSSWGFVAPEMLDINLDFGSLVPDSVQKDIQAVFGSTDEDESSNSFSTFLGSGGFVDNTLGISDQGDIYVIGGGQDDDHGALVQIRVGGTPENPVMEPGWYTPTNGGSATSPSISPGGKYVTVSDGSSIATFINPSAVDAGVKVMDIEACNANQDSNTDPDICGIAFEQDIERAPMIGAPAIDENGTTIFWELSLGFEGRAEDRDIAAFGPDGMLYEVALPKDRDWTSVITVTDNHLIGTATYVEHSDAQLLGFSLPRTTDNALVILDRHTGESVFEAPLHDDGAATVSVGPDGSLYVATLGIFSIFSTEKSPELGLIRFAAD